LIVRYPKATEGELTWRRVTLVRVEQLVTWAGGIDHGGYRYLGQGEKITEGTRDRMLATAFEALIEQLR
jgi:dsRNA-specific ribonuclease